MACGSSVGGVTELEWDLNETGVAVVFPLSVLTVVLNSLVIITIWKDPFKNLKGIPSYLILNLAVSDFLVGIPGMLLYVLSYWFPNESHLLNKASDITLHLVYYASCITILALAVERLIVISFPLKSADLTYTRLTLGILCIWLFAGLLAFLPLNAGNSFDCYGVIIHDALFFLIIISLFVCYGRIFFLVRKGLYRDLTTEAWYERQSLTENSRKREKIKRSERMVAFSVFILVGLFVVCLTPVIVLESLTEFCRNCMDSATNFRMALNTLPMLHPLANPIAYALCTVKFRRALWRIFCRR